MTCASRCGREAPVTCTHPRGQAPHETEFRMRLARLALALLSMVPLHVFAVEIDGRIEPGEWQGAYHVTDFRKVQPLSGAPASLPTEAWILATPEGLAEIGRASCRERVGQYVEISVGAGSLKKQPHVSNW